MSEALTLPKVLYRWVDRNDPNIKRVGLDYYVSNDQELAADLVEYRISSKGKTMTAEEYLSTTKGEGGNITGFMQYHPTRTQSEKGLLDASPGYYSLSHSHTPFGSNRDLFVFPTYSISPEDQEALVFTNGDLTDKIRSCPSTIKVAKLGSLMETRTHYGNDSEWNFIPNYGFTVLGLLIRFGKYGKPTEEVIEKDGKMISTQSSTFERGDINWEGLTKYVNSFYTEFEDVEPVSIKKYLAFKEC